MNHAFIYYNIPAAIIHMHTLQSPILEQTANNYNYPSIQVYCISIIIYTAI